MGALGAEGTVCGDWGGVTAGERIDGLPEELPSASFPISLYRGAPAKREWQDMQQKNTGWHQRKSKWNMKMSSAEWQETEYDDNKG